ncbi:feruloyl-CoA synthase [Pseudoduganella buxea]|uniref:AMP-binding protein n=1 Tax=Pseudoduganella buxea TaxID=1949069 RepID=A0A6I3T385_9BURK|nr:feruloyl-CoA synthase [Pseudoduganella buxea]MTV55879.1 AMP-binding protein [Pseudoduganella buxea]GGC22149.1 feruloyl-CoA synthase [Pseudoduganella buxea]
MTEAPNPPVPCRGVHIGHPDVAVRRDGDTWHVDALTPLGPAPRRFTDCLVRGARDHPERTLVARRGAGGAWMHITYARMLDHARHIGQALLDRGLSAERPLVILSGNDLQHLQLALGALYAGVPYVPVSPAWSLVATDVGRLRDMLAQLTPGAVYASDGAPFGRAIAGALPAGAELILDRGDVPGLAATRLADLLAVAPADVDAANAAIGPATIGKFLFTSGSTRQPKAVITTHGMLGSNQQMLLQTFPFFAEAPPVLVDWLPWNHTFGGSHNVGIALYNGGTLYLDEGRPTPQDFGTTVANLKEVAPTAYFNIPTGWDLLAEALEVDGALRDTFFSRVQLFFCAGAGLSQATWDRLDAIAVKHCGESVRIMTGLGMTETSPACTFGTGDVVRAGYVGVPAPGCRVKLAPVGDKFEARFKGPHVTPGYWRSAALTAAAFDEEGYYRTGDALRFADAARPALGFMFDGRIAEDFKLGTGTFVSAGPLRARVIGAGAPYVHDAVVTGIDRPAIGLLVFPRLAHCHALSGLPPGAPAEAVLDSVPVRAFFAGLLARLNADATGSATRVALLRLEAEPPSLDGRELTDKNTVNQAAVLARRAATIDAMYDGSDSRTIPAALPQGPASPPRYTGFFDNTGGAA